MADPIKKDPIENHLHCPHDLEGILKQVALEYWYERTGGIENKIYQCSVCFSLYKRQGFGPITRVFPPKKNNDGKAE